MLDDDAREIHAAFPPTLIDPLLKSRNRYVVLHGGRGGGKSWAVARALLIRAVETPLRILCVREYMSSIVDSVHKLLVDQIDELGFQDDFLVEKAVITGINGSEFRFAGIRNNPTAIKSYEGIDICWAEESASITGTSWQTLIPTIRKANSQIIVTFNAELATDDTWLRFIVNTPPDCLVTKINFDQNPFFPQVLRQEAEYMRENDPDSYQNIWLGYPKVYLENAVYANELRDAQESGRICSVPYDPLSPVHCFFDLGWRDQTSIILAQLVGFEFHLIDFVQGSQTTIVEYLRILQQKPYHYGVYYLPFDAAAKNLGTGRSIQEIMRHQGCNVHIVQRLSIHDGINAAKTLFERMWFDEKRCADLLQALRHYCYDLTGAKPIPVHDQNSHAADALRLMALSLRPAPPLYHPRETPYLQRAGGWMS